MNERLKSDWLLMWGGSTIVIGLILAFFSYKASYSMIHQSHVSEFFRAVDNQLLEFQQELNINFEVLYSIEGLYISSTDVNREEFRSFARRSLDRHESIQTLEWIPRVFHDDRSKFEELASLEVGEFQITENIGGTIVRAANRGEYYPVYYAEPLEENGKVLGYDLASNPVIATALKKARDSGVAAASARVKLVQEIGEQYSFLVFLPIYGEASSNKAERQVHIQGFALGVYRIGDMVEKSLRQLNNGQIDLEIHIYDITNGKSVLYPIIAETDHEQQEDQAKKIGMFYKTMIDVAGRTWKIELLPTKRYLANHHQMWISFIAPTILLLFTGLAFVVIKQRTHELRENKQQLRKLSLAVEQSPNLIMITDTSGKIEYVNPAFQRITGYAMSEALNKTPSLLSSGLTSQATYSDLWRTILTGEIWRGEMNNRRKDRSLYWALMSVSPVRDGSDTITHYLSVQEDITDRKKWEATLHQSKEVAENANRAKSEFLANMSHEIRTPMNAIIGMSQLVLETTLDEYQAKHLTTVNGSARALLRILNEILDFSKIESEEMEIRPEAYNLRNVVESALVLFYAALRTNGLTLEVDISETLPTCLWGDAGRITQVIQNLVSNSIKFTERGGITININRTNEDLLCSITDTGIGIPIDRQEAIFMGFTQADGGTSRKYGGTGLGTTISKRIVELMGGEIWVNSEVNKGSTFSFRVPLVEAECPKGVEDTRIIVLKPLRILLVEDQEPNWELVIIRLGEKNHDVVLAKNGKEAVKIWTEHSSTNCFDLILMDLQMPEMNGLEATRAIRLHDLGKEIPVIALTASSMSGDEGKCYEVGMNGYVSKPIDFNILWAEIGLLLPSAVLDRIEVEAVSDNVISTTMIDELPGVSTAIGLRRWGWSVKAYRKALLGFARDYSLGATDIRQEIETGDIEKAKSLVHALKGTSSNLAVIDIARISSELDGVLGEDRLNEVNELLIELEIAFRIAVPSINKLAGSVEKPKEKDFDSVLVVSLFSDLADLIKSEDLDSAETILCRIEEYVSEARVIRDYLDEYDFVSATEALQEISESIEINVPA